MATPSSSATSPSPPATFFLHTPLPPSQSLPPYPTDSLEQEQRQKAIKKFLARAEISMVTRALRTRLSYASYKAAHNVHHVSIRDLEALSQTQVNSFSRTIAAKRRATGPSYHNTSQGPYGSATGAAPQRRSGSSAMLPPASTSSPRNYYPAANANMYAIPTTTDVGPSSKTSAHSQSLYMSILAPPPAYQARTIHNAGDPPVPPPMRPTASPRVRTLKSVSKSPAETARSHAKRRKSDPASSGPSPRRKAKRSSLDKSRPKPRTSSGMDVDVDADGDVDMKAAATLTSLLLHNRPSIAGSASSPRSSIDGSEVGSSYSHLHPSAARIMHANSPEASISTSTTELPARTQTPPTTPIPAPPPSGATPRPAPADKEAANLMLFLATSPSPARPGNKDARDTEAFRALGGGSAVLRDKGRVLFASNVPESKATAEVTKASPLGRSGENSFSSSISSIGAEMGGREKTSEPRSKTPSSQLLPPPTFPSRTPSARSPRDVQESPRPALSQGAVEFNINDFIHGSPSPLRGTTAPGPKANLGLRADIGRKLFEEEQMRHAMSITQSPGKRHEEPALRAGIDLVKT